MSTKKLIQQAIDFETNYKSFKTRNEKIIASRQVKEIILAINEVYKKDKEEQLMEIMKRLTILKKKIETRLKGRL